MRSILRSIGHSRRRAEGWHCVVPPRKTRRLQHLLVIVACASTAANAWVQPRSAARPAAPAAAAAADAPGTIRVTAVVTDARGQVVRNLKAGDFELLVDGKPQALDAAEFTAVPAAAPRTIAFLLDEFHTGAGDSQAVREGLLRFVDARLRPGDFALVVKPLDSLSTIKPTDDRDVIRRAISSFEGRKGDLAPRTAFERDYIAQAPAAVESARAQIVTSALRAIGMTLSLNRQGQPAIVLVSDGFERLRAGRDVPANLQSVVRIANRAEAPVYAFAPSLNPPAEAADGPTDGGFVALQRLASDTGGAVFTGRGEFDTGFAQMARDMEAHYVLTYRAPHGNDGRFHALRVGVKRVDTQVRARSGYVAPMSDAARAALNPGPSAPLRVLRRSSLIQSWAGAMPARDGGVNVTLTWAPASASAPRRAATVVVTASAPDGTLLFDGSIAPVGERSSPNLPNHAAFSTMQAGSVRVDMKILDAKGVVLDTDARDFTIPSSRGGVPIIYPPAVLRARSAREFRQLVADPEAAAVPTRDFWRTERLLIRVAAADAAGTPVPVSATLLNKWRQAMRNVDPLFDATPQGPTQFDLPLADLVPGEYTLRISVRGPGGPVSEHITFRVLG